MNHTLKVFVADRFWAFTETLTITGPDMVFPCEDDAVFSPHTVAFRYAYRPERGWVLAPSELIGPRITEGECGETVTVSFDAHFMDSCAGGGCPHEGVPTPAWVNDIAAKRMGLLSEPPAI